MAAQSGTSGSESALAHAPAHAPPGRRDSQPDDRDAPSADTLPLCEGTELLITPGSVLSAELTELQIVERSYYAVEGEIARGGMGRIMRARDRRHGRVVAIKESLVSEPQLIARFTREALITARLQHPAIIPVYEAGQWSNGEPFYTMKLVDGRSVSREIGKRTSLRERMELLPNLIAVTEALAYAHTHGIIHRDLKPANIIIGKFGETVVIDWGLAKDLRANAGRQSSTCESFTDADADSLDDSVPLHNRIVLPPSAVTDEDAPLLTSAGNVIGTPAYMAPEQADGQPVDERADVYALGAIAYHLLSGRAPYQGDSSDRVLQQVVAGGPESIRKRAPGLPIDLAAIVERAMAREPIERYPSARELADDLRRFQTGQLVRTHAYSRVDLLRRFMARNRAAIAVATVMLVAMVGLGSYAMNRILTERKIARAATEKLEQLATDRRSAAEDVITGVVDRLDRTLDQPGAAKFLARAADKAMNRKSGDDPTTARTIQQRLNSLRLWAKLNERRGQFDIAEKAYRHSLTVAQELAKSNPDDPETAFLVADHHLRIGRLLASTGRSAGARAEYRAGIAVVEGMLMNDERGSVNIRTDRDEDTGRRARAQLDRMYTQLGFSLLQESDIDGSMSAYQNSLQQNRDNRSFQPEPPLVVLSPDQPRKPEIPPEAPQSDRPTQAGEHLPIRTTDDHIVETTAVPKSNQLNFSYRYSTTAPESVVPGPEFAILLTLGQLERKLQTDEHTQPTVDMLRKMEKSIQQHPAQLGAGAQLAQAKLNLILAKRLAIENPAQASGYAQRCVELLAPEQPLGPLADYRAELLRTAHSVKTSLATPTELQSTAP